VAPSCPHSSNKVVSTSVLSGILLQLGTQSGDFRRRPRLGSCNIRGQRGLARLRLPPYAFRLSGSFTVDRGILLRSAIPAALPSPSRITGCFPASSSQYQLLVARTNRSRCMGNVVEWWCSDERGLPYSVRRSRRLQQLQPSTPPLPRTQVSAHKDLVVTAVAST